ncbi:MAG: hypothetical protein KGL39_55345 [Patescibacteria group bacterium]|nr:hypothetical protein [Patescibacteria group bacterium]
MTTTGTTPPALGMTRRILIALFGAALLLCVALGTLGVLAFFWHEISGLFDSGRDTLTVEIDGPDSSRPGDIVVLHGKCAVANHFTWRVKPAESGGKPTSETQADGRDLRIATHPGQRLEILLLVSNSRGNGVAEFTHTVSGDAPSPTPNPPPNPAPGPRPQPPSPGPALRFGIGDQIPSWLSQVKSPAKAEETRRLTEAWAALQSKYAAGVTPTTSEVMRANTEATKPHQGCWREFLGQIKGQIEKYYLVGRLRTADEKAALFAEIVEAMQRAPAGADSGE